MKFLQKKWEADFKIAAKDAYKFPTGHNKGCVSVPICQMGPPEFGSDEHETTGRKCIKSVEFLIFTVSGATGVLLRKLGFYL